MPSHDPREQFASNQALPTLPLAVLEKLGQAVEQLHYGLIQLTVHDGKIVQLDVTQRHRF